MAPTGIDPVTFRFSVEIVGSNTVSYEAKWLILRGS